MRVFWAAEGLAEELDNPEPEGAAAWDGGAEGACSAQDSATLQTPAASHTFASEEDWFQYFVYVDTSATGSSEAGAFVPLTRDREFVAVECDVTPDGTIHCFHY